MNAANLGGELVEWRNYRQKTKQACMEYIKNNRDSPQDLETKCMGILSAIDKRCERIASMRSLPYVYCTSTCSVEGGCIGDAVGICSYDWTRPIGYENGKQIPDYGITCAAIIERVRRGGRRPTKETPMPCAECHENIRHVTQRHNKCGQCKVVYYCNETCQHRHWSEHKKTCGSFGK